MSEYLIISIGGKWLHTFVHPGPGIREASLKWARFRGSGWLLNLHLQTQFWWAKSITKLNETTSHSFEIKQFYYFVWLVPPTSKKGAFCHYQLNQCSSLPLPLLNRAHRDKFLNWKRFESCRKTWWMDKTTNNIWKTLADIEQKLCGKFKRIISANALRHNGTLKVLPCSGKNGKCILQKLVWETAVGRRLKTKS